MNREVQEQKEIAHEPAAVTGELLNQAVAQGLPVETIKELLAMRKELKAEWARDQFFADLSGFQAEMPAIPKKKEVKDKNGKVRYRYAPLDVIVETVKPVLHRHGFSHTMKPVQDEGMSFTARILIHHRDGHSEETSFTVPIDSDSYMSSPQKVGAARTFAMRYAFCNAFGILTSDEDTDADMGFDDGVKYADYINALESETDVEALRKLGKDSHDKLTKAGDTHGAQVILNVYNRRKTELAGGAS